MAGSQGRKKGGTGAKERGGDAVIRAEGRAS